MTYVNEISISYIAGLMDGEGCIGIYRKKNNSASKFYYRLAVTIVNTNHEVLEWICSIIGTGKVYPKKERKGNKDGFSWQVTGKKAGQFLQTIYPFLHIKKEECELALEFRKLISIKVKKIPKENYKRREELAFKLSEAKGRKKKVIKKCV